jgi:hypothetical protein
MTFRNVAVLVALAVLSSPAGFAAPQRFASGPDPDGGATASVAGSSGSSSLPDAPEVRLAGDGRGGQLGPRTRLTLHTAPFSAFAISVTVGIGGFGADVATPLATKINLRGSFSFLNYNQNFTAEGLPISGSLRFRSVGAAVDIYPYHNTFHISPGVTLYAGNSASGISVIAPGSSFDLNDTTYTSDLVDPVHGTFDVDFSRKYAPSLTVGWGNMLRRDSHWSFPVDIGFQYIGQPKFMLNLAGTACDAMDGCTNIQIDPESIENVQQEQEQIEQDIAPLRFYPILKFGVSYRFGRNKDRTYWR